MEKDIVETGFVRAGFTTHAEPIDHTSRCFWVPASIRHEVQNGASPGSSRHSFFVYGGVNINPRLNVLYQKVGPNGEHLKFGITKNPATRYSAAELGGGSLKIVAQGSRKEMLKLERSVHETLPIGPQERQSHYVGIQAAKGYKVPPYI